MIFEKSINHCIFNRICIGFPIVNTAISFGNRAILGEFPENLEMDRYTAPSASDVSVATPLLVPRILPYDHKEPIPGLQTLPQHAELSALRIL